MINGTEFKRIDHGDKVQDVLVASVAGTTKRAYKWRKKRHLIEEKTSMLELMDLMRIDFTVKESKSLSEIKFLTDPESGHVMRLHT